MQPEVVPDKPGGWRRGQKEVAIAAKIEVCNFLVMHIESGKMKTAYSQKFAEFN